MATPSSTSSTDALLQKLIDLQKGKSSSFASTFTATDTSAAEKFKDGLKIGKDSVEAFSKTLSSGMDTWRSLSKVGAGFSNDIVGMSTAAYQSRMSLEDYASVVKDNAKFMTGLGGSVGRGTEAFSKLSKGFFDSNFDKGLREVGYTTKELNEVLALTASAQKSSFQDTAEGQKRTNEAAVYMAKEMDMIAKLTGKSREAQMEEMKKGRVDGQVISKLRLLTEGKSAEEASKIKLEYEKGRLEAIKQGTEQSYKEFFATGTYLSETAATERALLGKQIVAQEDQIKSIQKGDMAGALEARERSASESLKNQADRTLNLIGSAGEQGAGAAGAVMVKQAETNDALYESVLKVKKEYERQNGVMLSWSEALKITKEKVTQEALGKDKEGKQRSGLTDGMIAAEKAQEDFKAGLATLTTLSKDGGKSLGDSLRDAGTIFKQGVSTMVGGPKGNLAVNMEERGKAGVSSAPVAPRGPNEGELAYKKRLREGSGGMVGEGTAFLAETGESAVKGAAKLAGEIATPNNPLGPLPKRNKGSLGETGKLFENFGSGTAVELHGMESVMRPEDLEKLVQNTISGLGQGMKSTTDRPTGSIDLSKISKDISTSISSTIGGGITSTKQVQSNESTKAIREEYAKKEEEFKLLGLKKGAAAEQQAREEYAKEFITGIKSDLSTTSDIREDYAKKEEEFKLLGLKQGVEAEQQAREEYIESFKLLQTNPIKEQDTAETAEVDSYWANPEKRNPTPSTAEVDSYWANPEKRNPTPPSVKTIEPAKPPSVKTIEPAKPPSVKTIEPAKPTSFLGADGRINLDMFGGSKFGKELQAGGVSSIAKDVKKQESSNKASENQSAAETARLNKPKQAATTQAATVTPKPTAKDSTLNDVVTSLDKLNTQMGQLVTQQSELMNKQIRTTRDTNSSNVYNRMTP